MLDKPGKIAWTGAYSNENLPDYHIPLWVKSRDTYQYSSVQLHYLKKSRKKFSVNLFYVDVNFKHFEIEFLCLTVIASIQSTLEMTMFGNLWRIFYELFFFESLKMVAHRNRRSWRWASDQGVSFPAWDPCGRHCDGGSTRRRTWSAGRSVAHDFPSAENQKRIEYYTVGS